MIIQKQKVNQIQKKKNIFHQFQIQEDIIQIIIQSEKINEILFLVEINLTLDYKKILQKKKKNFHFSKSTKYK